MEEVLERIETKVKIEEVKRLGGRQFKRKRDYMGKANE